MRLPWFNITSGSIMLGPIPTCGYFCLFGLTVFSEIQIATFSLRLPFDLAFPTSKQDGTDRINSYFDHEYPLQRPALGGTEPQTPGIGDKVYLYTGNEVPDCWTQNIPGCKYYSGHDAYDFSGTENKTIVRAAHDGFAVGKQWTCKGSSKINVIEITNGRYKTVYLHLYNEATWQSFFNNPRQVSAGEPIGKVGNTGSPICSKGAHLHFGVYFDKDNDGSFESNEKIDPYGFKPGLADPWELSPYNGTKSIWLWNFNKTAQTNLIPGNSFALASGNAYVFIPNNSFDEAALLALMSIPEPKDTSTLVANEETTSSNISLGSIFELTGVLSDSTPLTDFLAPISVTLDYGDLDITYVDEATIGIYQWDQNNLTWTSLLTNLNTNTKQATATVDTTGIFSLRAAPLFPAPMIAGVSQTIIKNNTATTITITGSNFLATPWVDIGITALDVSFISATTIQVVIPPGVAPGIYTLVLRNPDGQIAVSPNAITIPYVINLPIISR